MAGKDTKAGTKRTVLITGCSDGGLGAFLAIEFHKAGLHVYATARNPSKMAGLAALGIETLALDVLSESSITACVKKLSHLDILINNAGGTYTMPIADFSTTEAKALFDLNVWSYLAVTQAFLPLLIRSKGTIVNHTSGASVLPLPFQAAYNASKAAAAMFSDTLRVELQPFDITVIELKTSSLETNFVKNNNGGAPSLPEGSIYEPAKGTVEMVMSGRTYFERAGKPEPWAETVVRNVLKAKPAQVFWSGSGVWLLRMLLKFPYVDATIGKWMGKMSEVDRLIRGSDQNIS